MSVEPVKNYIEDEENDFEEIMNESEEEIMEEDEPEENSVIDDKNEEDTSDDDEDIETEEDIKEDDETDYEEYDEEEEEYERHISALEKINDRYSKSYYTRERYPYLTDDEYKIYMKTNEGALRLIKRCERLSDTERAWLEDDLLARNMNLVHYIANKKIQSKFMMSVQELIDAGTTGLAKALKGFDVDKGVLFATFAYRCIDNEIKYAIRTESKHYQNDVSMNKTAAYDKNGREMTLGDTIADPNKTPEEDAKIKSRNALLRELLNKLEPKKKYIIYARFGIDNDEEMTQKQVAVATDMSQANVSKIEKNCLEFDLPELLKGLNEGM